MPWRDSLLQLKQEISGARAARLERLAAYDRQTAAEREQLLAQHDVLGIASLVNEMNDILLDGQGTVEITVDWETGEDEELSPLDDDIADVISTVLSWNEGEELEVSVELVMLDEGLALMVNGIQIRQDRDALERALINAFREEMEL